MKDFTLSSYKDFLLAFITAGYSFIRFEEYCEARSASRSLPEPYIILRHDVDLKAANSLATAQIEAEIGVKASYYFRVVPESNQPEIIRAIAELGHEIGYHYEDMTIFNGDEQKSYNHFVRQLKHFREFYPVKTICMHGSPQSKFDAKDLWNTYNYRDLGIIGEPYFDVDFSQLFYLTDTGRRWDGFNVSVRDRVPVYQDEWIKKGWTYHSTTDIIKEVQANTQSWGSVMITTHPQRWSNSITAWYKELMLQSIKNVVKYVLLLTKK